MSVAELSRKCVRLSFISSIRRMGLLVVGSWTTPRNWTMLGCFIVSQDLALLLKSRDKVDEARILGVHDESMEDFSCTGVIVKHCLHNIAVGS